MFSKGVSWELGAEILIQGGGLAVERKKIPRLAIARHDPLCNTRLIFTLMRTYSIDPHASFRKTIPAVVTGAAW